MADKKTIGAKIALEGEGEYRKAISEINKSMTTMRSEMKLVNSEYRDNKNSVEALSAKQNVLKKEYDEQKRKVELLNSALEKARESYGENSSQVQNWQTKLNTAQAKLNDLDHELKENDKYLEEAKQSTDGTATSIDQYGKKVKSTSKDVEEASDSTEKLKNSFGSLTETTKKIGIALAGMATGLVALVESTKEYRTDLAKLKTNAEQAGESTEGLERNLKNLDAVTGETDSNIEALSNLMKAGFTGNTLDKVVRELSGAIIQFPDTLKIESLSDSLQETLATSEATGQFSELIGRLGGNVEDFNKGLQRCTDSAQKQQYALSQLKSYGLSGIYDSYVENNAAIIENANAQYDLRGVMSDIANSIAPGVARATQTLADKVRQHQTTIQKFAEKGLNLVVDGLTWIVDHGNEVTSVLVGIGTALVFSKGVSAVSGMIESFKLLKTAITAASAEQGILNAVMAATPTGLLIGAIAGLTVGLGSYIMSLQDTETEHDIFMNSIDEIKDNCDELNSSIEESKNSLNDNIDSVNQNAASAELLANSLFDLAEKENLSNAEKAQMSMLVSELNELFPELGLSIDDTTGKLNLSKDAVLGVVDSMKQQALMAAYQDMLKERADAVAKALIKQKEAEIALREAKELGNGLTEEETARFNELSKSIDENNWSFALNGNEWMMLKGRMDEAAGKQEAAQEAFDMTKETVDNANISFNDLSATIEQFTMDSQTESVGTFDEQVTAMTENFKAQVEQIKANYQEMYAQAEESIKAQIGLFDEFNTKTDLTKTDLQENLQSQIDGLDGWQENIKRIASVCSEDFVQELKDMGVDSAAEIKVLSSMTDEELKVYEETWRKRNKAVSEAAKTQVGNMNDEIIELQEELIRKLGNSLPEYEDTGRGLGLNVGKGVKQGIKDSQWQIKQQMIEMAKEALRAAEKELDINSPSRKARKRIGRQLGAGTALGIQDSAEVVKNASRMMARSSLEGINVNSNANAQSFSQNSLVGALANAMNGMKFEFGQDGFVRMVNQTMRRVYR